jgi:hypothetical protein
MFEVLLRRHLLMKLVAEDFDTQSGGRNRHEGGVIMFHFSVILSISYQGEK